MFEPESNSPYSREQRDAKARVLRALNDIWNAGVDITLVEEGDNRKKLKIKMNDEGVEGHWYGLEFDLTKASGNWIIRSKDIARGLTWLEEK